jgi:hypothetical protein
MPMCTYLEDREYTTPTGVPALDETLTELRKMTGRDWRIAVYKHVGGWNWWQPREVSNRYSLFLGVGGYEFQEINFLNPNLQGSSIHTVVDSRTIHAYMMGILAGMVTNPQTGERK